MPGLLGELYIEASVHGNVTQAEAVALANAVRGALPSSRWLPAEARPQDHCIALKQGATYLYRHVAAVPSSMHFSLPHRPRACCSAVEVRPDPLSVASSRH